MRRSLLWSWSSYSRRHDHVQRNCDLYSAQAFPGPSGATSTSTTVLDLGFGWPVIVLDDVWSEREGYTYSLEVVLHLTKLAHDVDGG